MIAAHAFSTPWLDFVDGLRIANIVAAVIEMTAFVLLLAAPGFQRSRAWLAGAIALCILLMSVVLTEVMRFGHPVGMYGRLFVNTAGVVAAGVTVVMLYRRPNRPPPPG